MNTLTFIIPKINLFEKRYLASRIACLVLVVFGLLFQLDSERIFVVNYIALVVMIIFGVQFFYQFKALNGILGGLLFIMSAYMILQYFQSLKNFLFPAEMLIYY